jgi:hypothetical protein
LRLSSLVSGLPAFIALSIEASSSSVVHSEVAAFREER